MQYVLTLCGASGDSSVTADVVGAAADALAESGAVVGTADWLADREAVDMPFDGTPPAAAVPTVRERLTDARVDANAGLAAGRRKRVLIADMDSTMIEGESLDELAAHAGLHERISAITARAMRGELDFEAALEERVALLEGLSAETIDAVVGSLQPTQGGRALVATMKAAGAYCALVSGGFKPMTGAIRLQLGFDEDRSNTLLVEDGALTGRVGRPILGQEAKLQALNELTDRFAVPADAVLAVGDGANDLAMIGAAGMGVAFRAKPAVRDAAEYRIEHADLRGLLYLQGFRATEIVD